MNSLQADAMLPRPWRVRERKEELANVVTLVLENDEGESLRFSPGQFNMLYRFGVGEVPISISGDPGDQARIHHTIRAVGMVSDALVRLQPGEWLGLRGPYGRGWPLDQAQGGDLVIAAGGLGLAPLRPVLHTVAERRGLFGCVVLYYGARTPEDLLFHSQLQQWAEQHDIDLQISVDNATPRWRGPVGVVTRLMSAAHFDPDSAVALLCGPEVMMRFSAQTLQRLGFDEDRIHLSMERNMQCGVGLCGHCQLGPKLVCRDGPVFSLNEIAPLMGIREL